MNTLFERNTGNYKDEWYTPPSIVRALGQFDLDPCAPMDRLYDTAKVHYTIADDGLSKSWYGRVWCNPPYSNLEEWIKRCVSHGNAIVLSFARVDTRWFFRHGWYKADSIFFFAGRIKFLNPEGKSKSNAGAPSVLLSYGKNNVESIEESGLQGKHIHLSYTPVVVVGISPTWVEVVKIAVRHAGDDELKPLYEMVERVAPDKVNANQHWKAKVRQCIQIIRKQTLK